MCVEWYVGVRVRRAPSQMNRVIDTDSTAERAHVLVFVVCLSVDHDMDRLM